MKAIFAVDDKLGIGKDNTIPWKASDDLKFFRLMTIGETICMGKNTAKSIGKDLPNRKNIILNRQIPLSFQVSQKEISCGWLIGGAKVFKNFTSLGVIDTIYLSRIKGDYECDTFIEIPSNFQLICNFKLDDLYIEKYMNNE